MNIISYQQAYLWGSAYFIPIWLWLFFRMPAYRRAMVIFGISYMWLGLMAQYLWWTADWWRPVTITGTRIGPEDFIMCFTHVAIPIFIYSYVFGKDSQEDSRFSQRGCFIRLISSLVILFGTIIILTEFLGLHSFISTTGGLALAGFYMIFKRKDLIRKAIWSSILMVALTLPAYALGSILSPGVIEKLWSQRIIGIVILGYPIEDAIWYGAVGFFFGAIYEFVANRKITDSDGNSLTKDLGALLNIFLRFIAGRKLDQ